jgi:hypothetical protein
MVMLTSTFDDTVAPTTPQTGTLADGAILYRRMNERNRKPAWVAPVAGAAMVAGVAAAALLLTAPSGREAGPVEIASTTMATSAVTRTVPPALAQGPTTSVTATARPSDAAPAPAPARVASTAPRRATQAPAAERAPAETLTTAPAFTPAPMTAAPQLAPIAPIEAAPEAVLQPPAPAEQPAAAPPLINEEGVDAQ